MFGAQTITDFAANHSTLRQARYGVIEIQHGELLSITLRAWPKLVDPWTGFIQGPWTHRRQSGDHCWLYYNQPRWHTDFLALKYVLSYRDTSLKSLFAGLAVLNEIARLKQSLAILADAANLRISNRLLDRLGWEKHTQSRWHRNYIKRFYGVFPEQPRWQALFYSPVFNVLAAETKPHDDLLLSE